MLLTLMAASKYKAKSWQHITTKHTQNEKSKVEERERLLELAQE